MYVGVHTNTLTNTHKKNVLGCTCSKLKLPALIAIPNCTVTLHSCLKSYKQGIQSEEEMWFLSHVFFLSTYTRTFLLLS